MKVDNRVLVMIEQKDCYGAVISKEWENIVSPNQWENGRQSGEDVILSM